MFGKFVFNRRIFGQFGYVYAVQLNTEYKIFCFSQDNWQNKKIGLFNNLCFL